MGRSQRWAGPLLLSLCAICLILQVLVRPAVGIANNGDFPKMAGPAALGPEDSWESHVQYSDFIYRYISADRYIYNRPFRNAEFLSSEFFFVKLARGLQKILHPGPRFDIRWLGAMHGICFLLAIGIWIYALAGRWRIYGGLFLILVWTDVTYVQYLNSFYMDTAAMIFLVLGIAAGLHVVNDGNNRLFPVIMAAAGILFATSKTQHALPGLLFIPLLLGFAIRTRDRVARLTWIAGSLLLGMGVYTLVGRVTDDWRRVAVFNVVFARLTPQARDPLGTLQDLGLGRDELRFVGMYTFLSYSPIQNPQWALRFGERCNYGTLFRYYLRHPSETAHLLYQGVSVEASNMRPYANLSVEDGFKPHSQASHFTYWTDLRVFLLKHAPWHMILLALAIVTGAFWLMFISPVDRAFGGLLLMLQSLAAAEYVAAVLADGVETARHLIVSHVATEMLILLLPLCFFKIYDRYPSHKHALDPVLPATAR